MPARLRPRPDVAIALYPGHLSVAPASVALNPVIASRPRPVERCPQLVEQWLHTLGVLGR